MADEKELCSLMAQDYQKEKDRRKQIEIFFRLDL